MLLHEVSFALPESQFAGILGPSGAGKSTLLRALAGLASPEGGQVLVDGVDIYARHEPPSFGYVPQDDIVHRELTVVQALRFSARLRLSAHTPAGEIERLFAVWRSVAGAVSRGPLVRTLGRKWTLDMMLRPLTALMKRPSRLVYLSSGMHRGGTTNLDDPLWASRRWNGSQAYSDSKLQDVWLAFAIARHWPNVLSNAVHPGWVPTKMGGAGAPDDLEKGAITQAWLAVSDDAKAKVTGKYFFHQKEDRVLAEANDPKLQDQLIAYCRRLTGIELPPA